LYYEKVFDVGKAMRSIFFFDFRHQLPLETRHGGWFFLDVFFWWVTDIVVGMEEQQQQQQQEEEKERQ